MKRHLYALVLSLLAFVGCSERAVGYDSIEELFASGKIRLEYCIFYTTNDGNKINSNSSVNANIISHTIEENRGRIIYDRPITYIGGSMFASCHNLTSITIPDSVTEIGESAFYNCTSLISVNIPNSVTKIEAMAFARCASLKRITIPDSVTLIDEGAFSGCTNLLNIYCQNQQPFAIIYDQGFDASGEYYEDYSFPFNSDMKIYVPQASVNAYKTAKNWSNYASVIVGYDF